MFFSHFCSKNARFSATPAQKMHIFQTLPPEKRTFFSHFCPKMHVFQPLPPEKHTFLTTST
jgi:hypothetical protein